MLSPITKPSHINSTVTIIYHILLLTATILLPFGVAAGDELGTSGPVSLSCQFYGVEEDTVYVRNTFNHNFPQLQAKTLHPYNCYVINIYAGQCIWSDFF